jgi:3-oxoacyl-[acyl-carrier protein] reductase
MQPDEYSIIDKVAIVTGGGKGLGLTIAQTLLQSGMKVAICGRNQQTISEAVEILSLTYPERIIGEVCDVSDAMSVKRFVSNTGALFGDVNVLINNSGFGKDSLVHETTEADWDDVMDTNVKGAFLMSKACVPAMMNNREGYILNIASQAALNGYAHAGVYCASKFAMVGLGKALQEEVRDYGVHVHSLNPALIQSQKTPDESLDAGLIQNEDLAAMVVYLLQQPRRLKIDNIGLWGF